MRRKKMILFMSILCMAIGFASVSAVLYLNGQTSILGDANQFDVYFSRALENGVENNALIQDKTHLTFTTELNKIDEEYVLSYEVTNASKQYDASIMMNCTGGNEYLRVSNEFEIAEVLPARTTRPGTLTLSMIKNPIEEMRIEINCEIKGNAVEREEVNAGEISDETSGDPTESILNGTDPVLKDGLIPITIANDGTVTYANTNNKWYSYENKEWANAVILKSGVTHEVGDVIPEDDIESYFVWIPKYKYQIFDMGNYTGAAGDTLPSESIAKEIQIEFTTDETTDTDTSCVSPKIAGESGTCEVGKWMTHPAFQNFDVTGLWVGKFETGYKDAKSTTDAQKFEMNNLNDNKIIIKPNVYSWRRNNVNYFFKSFYAYKRELDSHMMKNTEWGAVAYLSHSKYGINTEVRINNNSNFLTGYAATDGSLNSYGITEDKNLPYNTETGYKASTTGNITGIYDMSGGANEYVAGSRGVGESALTAEELTTYAKYIDTYPTSGNSASYSNRILGDATGEMGPFYNLRGLYQNNWYTDYSNFIDSAGPWFRRGNAYAYGDSAGPFYFNKDYGRVDNNIGARLVLAVK